MTVCRWKYGGLGEDCRKLVRSLNAAAMGAQRSFSFELKGAAGTFRCALLG
jgi:hypothetical protein